MVRFEPTAVPKTLMFLSVMRFDPERAGMSAPTRLFVKCLFM